MTPVQSSVPPLSAPRSIRPELYPLALAGVGTIGLVVYELQLRGILLLLLAACIGSLGLLVLLRPALGLAGVVACAAVVRIKVSTGSDSPLVASLVVALGLVVAWFAHRALHRQPVLLLPSWVMRFSALLCGATIFSLLWGRVTLDPRVVYPPYFIRVQLAAAGLVCVSVGLLFVGADLLRGRPARTALMVAYLAIGFAALPFRLLALHEPLLNSAGLFGVWFVALCWGHALGWRSAPPWLRALCACGALGWLGMAVGVEGDWISGWVPAAVGLLAVTLLLRPRAGAVLLIACLVVFAAYYSVFYGMLVTQQESDGSLGGQFGRLQLWERNLQVIEGRYTLGTGPAGYALYYVTFVPDKAMSTHSNYVDTLAQFGIPGTIGLLGMLGSLGIAGLRVFRRLADERDRIACAVALAGLPALAVAMMLGDWLIPFVYNQTIAGFDHSVYSWLMLAMLAGLIAQSRATSATEPAHA